MTENCTDDVIVQIGKTNVNLQSDENELVNIRTLIGNYGKNGGGHRKKSGGVKGNIFIKRGNNVGSAQSSSQPCETIHFSPRPDAGKSNITDMNIDTLSNIFEYLDPISEANLKEALKNAVFDKNIPIPIAPPHTQQPNFDSLNCSILHSIDTPAENSNISDYKLILNYNKNPYNPASTIENAQEQIFNDKIFIYSLLKTIVSKYYTLGFIEILMKSDYHQWNGSSEYKSSKRKSMLIISFFKDKLNVEFNSEYNAKKYYVFELINNNGIYEFDYSKNCYEINRIIYNIKNALCPFYTEMEFDALAEAVVEEGATALDRLKWKSKTISEVFQNAKIKKTNTIIFNTVVKNVFNILLEKEKLKIQEKETPENKQIDSLTISDKVPENIKKELYSESSKLDQRDITKPVTSAAEMIIKQLTDKEIIKQAKTTENQAEKINLLGNYVNSSEAIILYAKEYDLNDKLIDPKTNKQINHQYKKIPLMQFVSHYGSSMTSSAYKILIQKYINACKKDNFLDEIAIKAEDNVEGTRTYFESNLFYLNNESVNDDIEQTISDLFYDVDEKQCELLYAIEYGLAPKTDTHQVFFNTVKDIKLVIHSYEAAIVEYNNKKVVNKYKIDATNEIIKRAKYDLRQIYINYANNYYETVNLSAAIDKNPEILKMHTELNNSIVKMNEETIKYNKNVGNIYFYYETQLYRFNDYMLPLKYINPVSVPESDGTNDVVLNAYLAGRLVQQQQGGLKKSKSHNKSKKTTNPKIKKFVLGIERIVTKDPVTKKEMITYNREPMFLCDARKLDSQKKKEKDLKNKTKLQIKNKK